MTPVDSLILSVLAGVYWLPSAAVVVLVVGGVYFGIQALLRGNALRAALMLVLATLPFAAFASRSASIENSVRQSAETVKRLPKTGPLTSWPRVLVVQGQLNSWEAAKLLVQGDFAEVLATRVKAPSGKAGRFAIKEQDGCRARLRERVAPTQDIFKWNNPYSREPVKGDPTVDCIVVTGVSEDYLHARDPALVLNTGTDRARRSENISLVLFLELRLRSGSRDELVDIWENPSRKQVVAPWLVGWDGFMTNHKFDQKSRPATVDFVLKNLVR